MSIVASKAENGSIMDSIAAALLTEIEARLANMVAALDNNQPAQLTVRAVRQVSVVERVLPGEQTTEPVAEELETSEIVLVEGQAPSIVRVAEPDSVRARERVVVPAAVRAWLDPVPA